MWIWVVTVYIDFFVVFWGGGGSYSGESCLAVWEKGEKRKERVKGNEALTRLFLQCDQGYGRRWGPACKRTISGCSLLSSPLQLAQISSHRGNEGTGAPTENRSNLSWRWNSKDMGGEVPETRSNIGYIVNNQHIIQHVQVSEWINKGDLFMEHAPFCQSWYFCRHAYKCYGSG